MEVEDQEPVAAPTPLRRSRRNISEAASKANSESKKLSSAPVEANDLNIAQPLAHHDARAGDVEKKPAVKEPVRRLTRKSVGSAMLEKDVKGLIEEKNAEACVRRSMRKSVVSVEDIKGSCEEIDNADSEVVVKQPATKGAVRQSRHKSTVSAKHDKEKDLIAEKTTETHDRRPVRKSVISAKDIKVVGEEIQNAKGKDVEEQLVVKQPVRRSSRKSVLPDTLESDSGFPVAERNAEAHVRRSTRKSVLPNTLNDVNQDHSKMVRNESLQSGNCEEEEKQQAVKVPVRRSRRSIAAVVLEEQNKGLHKEKISNIPMGRSSRKSVAVNVVEKGSMEQTGMVEREQGRVDEEGPRLRKRRRSSKEISYSANNSRSTEEFGEQKFRQQQNAQTPNGKDDAGENHDKRQVSNSATSKGRSSKRRQPAAPEEVMSVEDANDGMVIKEAANGASKAAHDYITESSSRIQEIDQVNGTREEFCSGQLLATVTLSDEICTAQSAHKVIPGLESGDLAKGSSDKSKQLQEDCDVQADDSHLSENRNGELDQSSIIVEQVPHNGIVSEDKISTVEASPDVLPVDFTVGNHEKQSPVAGQGRVNSEANTCESGEKNLAAVISMGLHTKSRQHDIGILAKETHKDVVPVTCTIEEHGENYPVAPMAVQKRVIEEANACESAGKALAGILSNGLQTKDMQHDSSALTKEIGQASGAVLPTSDSDPEIHCEAIAEESVLAADMEKCLNKSSKGKLLFTNLHSEGAAGDSTLPVLNTDEGRSSDGGSSLCDLEFLFGDKKLDVDQGAAEEVAAEEKSTSEVAAEADLKTNDELAGLDEESDCSIVEKDARFLANNPDAKQATIHVQQVDVQEGDLEKASLCSATPEYKHECSLAEELLLRSKKNKGCLSSVEQSPFCLQSLFLQESIEESVNRGALAAATGCTEDGFDELKECNVLVPSSHNDTDQGSFPVSKNDAFMCITQKENIIEGLPKASLDEGLVSSGFSQDTNPLKEFINSEEVVCDGQGRIKLVHSEDLKASSEQTIANGPETGVVLPAEERSNLQDGQLNSKLEGIEVVESGLIFKKDTGSVLGTAGEITPSGSGLPKNSSMEYNRRQELSDGFSVEASLDGPPTCTEKIVSRVDAIDSPSSSFATPGYKHEGGLSEEAMRTVKIYAGTRSSNPRGLLMELQSMFSKESIEESDPNDGLASPNAEISGDESIDAEQRTKVHLDSNLSQLEPTDLSDELTGCPDTRVLHHGHKERCRDDRVEQIASRVCTNDIVEAAAAAKNTESGLMLLPSEKEDEQLNPMLEGPKVIGDGLNHNNDVSSTVESGSVMLTASKRTPSRSSLPEAYTMDQCPQQELFDGFSEESSLQATISRKEIVSGVEGTIGNPSFSLATSDSKSVLSDELVHKMENYTETHTADPKHLLMELQSLFSDGSIGNSDSHDGLAFPCAERGIHEASACHVEKLVDTLVSSEPDTCEGPRQDLSRAKEKECSMSVSSQDNGSGGFLRSSLMKDWVISSKIDMSDDSCLIERDITAEEVFCEEKERRKSMPTSDGHGVLRQHQTEDYSEHNVDQVASGICDMLEASPVKELENGIAQIHAAETSALPDKQLKGGVVEKHSLNCEKDTSQILGSGSLLSKTALLPKGSRTVYCQEQELTHELSTFTSADGSAIRQDESVRSGICQSRGQKYIVEINCELSSSDTEVLHPDLKEECSKSGKDGFSPKVLQYDMSETAPIEGMENAIMLPPKVGTLEMPDEQFNSKTTDDGEEHNFSCDKDTAKNFCTGSVNNDMYPLPKDCHIDSCQEQEVPEVISLSKSLEKSVNHQDNSIAGSGPCQTSWQEFINEGCTILATTNVEVLNEDHEEHTENLEGQITPGIAATSVSEAAEMELPEREIGLVPAAGTIVLPDEQLNTKLEGNEVDEHNCSYETGFSSLSDTELVNREVLNLHKGDHMDLPSEEDHPNDLPAPRSPEQSMVLPAPRSPEQSTVSQNGSVLASVGIDQSSRPSGIDELRAKLQRFKVSSTVKGSYIAMSAPRAKPGDNLSQYAIALLRNRENTPAVKDSHDVKLNPDRTAAKDSSRRALQPISGRPREH
ncbi:hypothetical protein BS78_08G037600 [Paspalum vaginatum]|nr:hypothetical protein BS78_08G037600 [Paspalum vaginatum]